MALTPKLLQQARSFLFQNGERPAKGVKVGRWVQEFATLSMDHRISFTKTLMLIRAEREKNGNPTRGNYQSVE